MELTLLGFQVEVVLTKALKDLGDVVMVLLDGGWVYEYVVYVDEDEPVDQVSEDFVHEILEDGRWVG